jgi:hypothetical protein
MIATEAAETLQPRPTATPPILTTNTRLPSATPIVPAQSITIDNLLNLSVKISINNVPEGDIDARTNKTFLLNDFPVTVQWSVNKWTTLKGDPLGHDMSGIFSDINSGEELTIDNDVDGQYFFYPIITNTTKTDCDVTINKGWKSEYVTNAVVPANSGGVGMGYYKLFTNSNVTLTCGTDVWWWGQQPDSPNDTSFYDDVEKDTGVISFTLKP